MGYYDAYNARLTVAKTTPRTYETDLMINAIQKRFFDSPSYYQVPIASASTPQASTPVDVWIVDDNSDSKELKKIQLYPSKVLNYGDLVYWYGDYWLTTSIDNMGDVYYRGTIQRCYATIKWLDSISATPTKETPFTLLTDSQKGLGVNLGQEMFLPDERRYVAIQKNVDTLKIVKGQRFILDNNRTWQVLSINTLLSGIIHLELQEVVIDTSKDRTDLRIADYTSNPSPTGGNLW